jgi:hypothetical protein
MNPFVCALTLILSCDSRVAAALNVGHAAVAFTDVYYTQRSYDLCRVFAGCREGNIEANPLTRPFQRSGRPIAYESTHVGLTLSSFIGQKMRKSQNRVLKRLWWLPQSALLGASIYGIQSQARDYGAALARCGRGCALALGR